MLLYLILRVAERFASRCSASLSKRTDITTIECRFQFWGFRRSL